MKLGERIYLKILTEPEYLGFLSGIIASIFRFSQIGLLIAFGITAILYTFKNKRTMLTKELFKYMGSWGLFSFIISIFTILLNPEAFVGNMLPQVFWVAIWTIVKIFEGVFIFFVFGLIVSSIIVLFSGNKQTSRFISFIDYLINSCLITSIFIFGLIFLFKLYF